MTNRTVIGKKYLPTRLPVVGTVFWLFLMHYYNVPGWVWGVSITLLSIAWIAIIFTIVTETDVAPSEVEKR